MTDEERNNDYDLEPVIYCSRCYSLKIKHDDTFDEDYCMDCGCTDMSEAPVAEWEALYQNRYGNKFAERGSSVGKSPIYRMNMQELKELVSNSPNWKEVIRTLYPGFPGGLSKTDSILLLFDKLIADNRIDELKITLANKFSNKTN